MILDTAFVIDFVKGNPRAVSKMESMIENGIPISITTPTIVELWSGLISLKKSILEKQKIISFVNSLIIYDLDKESAEEAGRIDGELIKNGLEIDTEDSMIAGIAKANNQKILTRDGHFRRIEWLKVESY